MSTPRMTAACRSTSLNTDDPAISLPPPSRRPGPCKRTGYLLHAPQTVLLTTFRTELDSPLIVAYVAWLDHTRTALPWYPGRCEPPNAPLRGPMMVPSDQRWRLLATFNGAFTYAAG